MQSRAAKKCLPSPPPGNENFHAVALNAQGTRLAARTDNGIYVWDATPLPD